jgi:hypothetical protein
MNNKQGAQTNTTNRRNDNKKDLERKGNDGYRKREAIVTWRMVQKQE